MLVSCGTHITQQYESFAFIIYLGVRNQKSLIKVWLSWSGNLSQAQRQTISMGIPYESTMKFYDFIIKDFYNYNFWCMQLHLRYQIEDQAPKAKACLVQASVGIAWLKTTKHQKKITKNALSSCSSRIKQIFSTLEKEFSLPKS